MRTTRKLEFNRINEDKNILSNIKDGTGTNSLVQNSSSTNDAKADQAFAIGLGTIAGYANQFVMGKFNSNKAENLFEIGFGSDTTHRRNILELNQDGALTAQYVGITSDGLRFYNNSSNGELGINLTTLETSAGRTAIKKFVFYDGTGDTSKKAEIEAKTLTAASCSIANAPVGATDVIRKKELDNRTLYRSYVTMSRVSLSGSSNGVYECYIQFYFLGPNDLEIDSYSVKEHVFNDMRGVYIADGMVKDLSGIAHDVISLNFYTQQESAYIRILYKDGYSVNTIGFPLSVSTSGYSNSHDMAIRKEYLYSI